MSNDYWAKNQSRATARSHARREGRVARKARAAYRGGLAMVGLILAGTGIYAYYAEPSMLCIVVPALVILVIAGIAS